MDVRYFLKKRTAFLMKFYDTAAGAFAKEMEDIQSGEPPYDNPVYSEDPEPPYLDEWLDANTSVKITGLACLSMLSEALKLYFDAVRRDVGFEFTDPDKIIFKKGFVAPYREALGEIFETNWTEVGIDFALFEQIVLARNRSQHGGEITSWDISHDAATLAKHPVPFFAQKHELESMPDTDGRFYEFLAPSVDVTREKLFLAIQEAEKLADWIEENIGRAHWWRSNL